MDKKIIKEKLDITLGQLIEKKFDPNKLKEIKKAWKESSDMETFKNKIDTILKGITNIELGDSILEHIRVGPEL